jgi:hypothetical protein
MLSVPDFWGHCFKRAGSKAWKLFGHFRAVAGLLAGIFALGLFEYFSHSRFGELIGVPSELQPIINKWLVIGPFILFCLAFIYYFMRAPYEVYRETTILCEQEKELIRAELAERNIIISKVQTDWAAANAKQANTEKERVKREKIREALANALNRLQIRYEAIRKLNTTDYSEAVHKDEFEATFKIINQVFSMLERFCDSATALSFKSANPEEPQPLQQFDTYSMQQYHRLNHVRVLDAFITALKHIIDQYPPLE